MGLYLTTNAINKLLTLCDTYVNAYIHSHIEIVYDMSNIKPDDKKMVDRAYAVLYGATKTMLQEVLWIKNAIEFKGLTKKLFDNICEEIEKNNAQDLWR